MLEITEITREQFEAVRPMLEAARKKTRPRIHDLFDVLSGIIYYIDSGISWRNLPPHFPPWRTVHEYFTQWQSGSESDLLAHALASIGRHQTAHRLARLVRPQ